MDTIVMILIALAAVAFVVAPLLDKGTDADATSLDEASDAGLHARNDAASIEREVRRYRAAVRAGTVCPRCAQANPGGSRYCYECGGRIGRGKTAAVTGNVTA